MADPGPPTTARWAGGDPAVATPARPILPAMPVPPETGPARQFLAEDPGAWIVPREIHALALVGGVQLDSPEASSGPGATEVAVIALRGGVDAIVLPGLQVECVGAGVLGGLVLEPDELADASVVSSDPGSPVLRVHRVAPTGGVTDSTCLPDEWEKDTAHRRKRARRARRKEPYGW